MKVELTLYIDEELVKRAKEVGIDLSQFLENNLMRAIAALDED